MRSRRMHIDIKIRKSLTVAENVVIKVIVFGEKIVVADGAGSNSLEAFILV
jgi:hypothetical protein